MAFSAQDVAKLREQTGAGMMDCKKALTHTDGDMAKAATYLREQGISVAAKKADRVASEGAVASFISKDNKVGAVVEINCESDFVAKNDGFLTLCNDIAEHIAVSNPKDEVALLEQKFCKDNKVTVGEHLTSSIAKIGEKLTIRRFTRYESKGAIASYIHMGGKIGVMLDIDCSKVDASVLELGKDIAMHIAAFAPSYVDSTQVPASELEAEKEVFKKQAEKEGKPEHVIQKMVEGRAKKYYKDVCLLDQEFAKDNSVTVAGHIQKTNKDVKINRFVRFVTGEGIQKKVDNLAEEVAKMTKK